MMVKRTMTKLFSRKIRIHQKRCWLCRRTMPLSSTKLGSEATITSMRGCKKLSQLGVNLTSSSQVRRWRLLTPLILWILMAYWLKTSWPKIISMINIYHSSQTHSSPRSCKWTKLWTTTQNSPTETQQSNLTCSLQFRLRTGHKHRIPFWCHICRTSIRLRTLNPK
jgi:hypothetical protein